MHKKLASGLIGVSKKSLASFRPTRRLIQDQNIVSYIGP